MSDEWTTCVGCGAQVPDIDGPTHKYLESAPGCWAWYGEVLAREYQDFRYGSVHNLTVDAYALQHPGTSSKQTIQSAVLHLLTLHLQLEQGYNSLQAAQARQKLAAHKEEFVWLVPPAHRGTITIVDIRNAPDPASHIERVHAWAREVYSAWEAHHETAQQWIQRL